jgi:hypothetical protein
VAADLWPVDGVPSDDPDDSLDESQEGDVETQIASEMSAMKRPTRRTEPRFGSSITQEKKPEWHSKRLHYSKLPDEHSLRYCSNLRSLRANLNGKQK